MENFRVFIQDKQKYLPEVNIYLSAIFVKFKINTKKTYQECVFCKVIYEYIKLNYNQGLFFNLIENHKKGSEIYF